MCRAGSVAAVVAAYLDSQQAFASKSAGTQRMRRGILNRFRDAHGERPFAQLPPQWIEALLDSKPPHAARSWLVTLRSLCQFALKRGWLRADPTKDIKLQAIKSDGHHTWTNAEIAQYEAHYPIGTRERLAFALLLCSAQRRSDVVRMGRQHLSDCLDEELRALGVRKMLSIRQQKTGKLLVVPVHPALQTVLDATPSEHLTFLTTENGKPYGGNYLTESFRQWCTAVGLPTRCRPHGLRKAFCRRMIEAGVDCRLIMAFTGHESMKELIRYTKAASQALLARNAMKTFMVGKRTEGESKVSNSTDV
jgi:integrase